MKPDEFFRKHPSLKGKVIQPLYLAAQAKEFAENEQSSFPVVHIDHVARTQTDNAIIEETINERCEQLSKLCERDDDETENEIRTRVYDELKVMSLRLREGNNVPRVCCPNCQQKTKRQDA